MFYKDKQVITKNTAIQEIHDIKCSVGVEYLNILFKIFATNKKTEMTMII